MFLRYILKVLGSSRGSVATSISSFAETWDETRRVEPLDSSVMPAPTLSLFLSKLNSIISGHIPSVAEGGEEPLAPVETALLHLIAVFFLTRFLRMIQGTLLDYQLGQKSSKVTLPKLRTFLHIASCSHGHAFLELQYTHLDTEKHATPALRPPQSSTHQKILRPCNLLNDEALWI